MANFPKLKLTNAGINLLTNVQAGADDLLFTKAVLGDGELSTPLAGLTRLVSPKIEVAITEGKKVGAATYQISAFFSNIDITIGFWWREIGVFAKGKDGNEILYAYSNAGDAGDYIPVGSDERVEKYIYLSLSIGNAESVNVEVNASDTFIVATEKGAAGGVAPLGEDGKIPAEYLHMDEEMAEKVAGIEANLNAHAANKQNPHGTTAAQVGLDKVPNVATNDQTPTYVEASTLATLTSGEKISVAFGKIKKAITDFIAHIANATMHITAAERTAWNAKAPASHASTAATYGVGTSSNYGHLKITDSKTSTATDTAASAKALAETYAVAKSNEKVLLKTMNFNIDNITWAGATDTAFPLPITGVDWDAYDEFEIVLNGTIKAPTVTGTATRALGIGFSADTGNSTTVNGGWAQIAVVELKSGYSSTFNIENLKAKIVSDFNHKQFKYNAETTDFTHYAYSYTGSSAVYGIGVRSITTPTGGTPTSGTIYFKIITFQQTSLSAATTLSLTANIYGKGARV